MLAHIDHELGFAASLKSKVEIITHDAAVDAHDAIARFEFQLGAQTSHGNFGNFDTAAANLSDCRRDCELVHLNVKSLWPE